MMNITKVGSGLEMRKVFQRISNRHKTRGTRISGMNFRNECTGLYVTRGDTGTRRPQSVATGCSTLHWHGAIHAALALHIRLLTLCIAMMSFLQSNRDWKAVRTFQTSQIIQKLSVHPWIVLAQQGSGSERRCELRSSKCVIWFQKSLC